MFFWICIGNIKLHWPFLQFVNIPMTEVVEMLSCGRQGPLCSIRKSRDTLNTVVSDELASQGARASGAMVLHNSPLSILSWTPEELTGMIYDTYEYWHYIDIPMLTLCWRFAASMSHSPCTPAWWLKWLDPDHKLIPLPSYKLQSTLTTGGKSIKNIFIDFH